MLDNMATKKLEELIKKLKEAGISKDDFVNEMSSILNMDAYGSNLAYHFGDDIVEVLKLLLATLD